MAEKYGVKITGLKTWTGMEGPAAQGNIRYNGHLLGFWSQDGNGGCDRYEFDVELLRPAFEEAFKNELKRDDGHRGFSIKDLYAENGTVEASYADVMLNQLAIMTEEEKDMKKQVKKGFPVYIRFIDDLTEEEKREAPNAEPVVQLIYFHRSFIGKNDEAILNELRRQGYQNPVILCRIDGLDAFDAKWAPYH